MKNNPPQNLREAVNHLRRWPQVEIQLHVANKPKRVGAIFVNHRRGLVFQIYSGEARLVGMQVIVPIDGGDSAWETTLEFKTTGFVATRCNMQVGVSYTYRRPWQKGEGETSHA